jgi:hypothetical protein
MKPACAVAATLVLAACGASTSTPASAALRLGISDPLFNPGAASPLTAPYYAKAKQLGSSTVRITVLWREIATKQPSDPSNPDSSAYDFGELDASVRAAAAAGQQIVLLVASAPAWAEGAGRDGHANAGSWRPDATAFGDFMLAVATRYSGKHDAGGGPLPFVAGYQLWNEPNLSVYVTPQWTKAKKPASPGIYRALVNAAYPQIKAASPRALVIEAGTAPYGDPKPGGSRMAPALFTRALLCEAGSSARPRTAPCKAPIHLDVFAHHPYGVDSPFVRALWPDDVTLADLSRLTRAWALAERTHRVLPAGHRPRWVTEFGWESKPDPDGLSQATQAAWMGQALYQLDAAGFSNALWFHLRDDAPDPSFHLSVQSGLFVRDGSAKPAVAMYAFPAAAVRRGAGKAVVFALAPVAGTCAAQALSGSRWVTRASGPCSPGTAWQRRVSAKRGERFRVSVAARLSPVVGLSGR